jgi:AsmA protein
VRYKDGKTNIDDLTGGGDKSATPEGGEPQVRIDIGHLAVEGATITYTDQAQGITFALSKLNLKTGRMAKDVPSKIVLSFTAQSDKPKLNLETALKTTVSFDLDKQNYALIGLDLSTHGLAAGISNLGATVKGDVDAKLASQEFLISKLAIEASAKQESGEFNAKLDVPKLTVSKDNVSGEKIALEMTLNQAKSKIVARLDIPGIDGNAQSFKAGGLTASAELQKGGATIKARLTSPLAGSVEAQQIELAKLVATVNVNNPALPKNPLDVAIKGSALIDLAKQNASLTFAAKFDDTSAHGKASLAKFTPPFYTFDCNIDQLDADRYLPQPDPRRKQPEQLLDLSALKGLSASGSLKIGSLKVSNVHAANVRVDVKAND